GDILKLNLSSETIRSSSLSSELIPTYTTHWQIGVLYGPHGAPDFFTDEDIEMLFSTDWEVHYNSARTGVRLIGPKPKWARPDGGEAGLHPSNIHDNAYAIGTIDFTGDMPIILGPDGPSLGGFVCPATIVQAELWKIGQLKPSDKVRFQPLTLTEAIEKERIQDETIRTLEEPVAPITVQILEQLDSAILHEIPASLEQLAVKYRRSGDKYLLVEYGDLVLDLNLRFQVHALMVWLLEHPQDGILDLTPGIRSLQIHYDSRILSLDQLLNVLISAEHELSAIDDLEVPTRIVHLPLSWDNESTQLAIEKYMRSVNPHAPWCPNNIEFIRRINGLETIEQVREIVFNASYLVLGLGDVYLGAPVATPIDPRHRLVTTKYNPARTWTPENAVGIGGAYLCVYGMEGPGGYQFVGRTVQMWNTFHETLEFEAGKPWLLRFFDQIRFYPVTADELSQLRKDFIHGRAHLRIESTTFNLKQYNEFLRSIANETAIFKSTQQTAFEAERERWAANPLLAQVAEDPEVVLAEEQTFEIPPNSQAVMAQVPANVWQVIVEKGAMVKAGDRLVILESMKMEITVAAPADGTISEIFCSPGQTVSTGQMLCIIRPVGE
ncbi:MAG: carboxyltransferase domain-containing protein, partial [Leptolyngbya sp. Prado105]|nr:carboxyltransferase domain-containing protein [Leptolyngbya sp. Prado105]